MDMNSVKLDVDRPDHRARLLVHDYKLQQIRANMRRAEREKGPVRVMWAVAGFGIVMLITCSLVWLYLRWQCNHTSDPGEAVCGSLEIVSREQWRADQMVNSTNRKISEASCTVIQFSEKDWCHESTACASVLKQLQWSHAGRTRNADFKYNFLLGGDTRIYEGIGWVNSSSTGLDMGLTIGVLGNLTADHRLQDNLRNLLLCGVYEAHIKETDLEVIYKQEGKPTK